ncbi:hypothetical protein RJ639_040584 [Escallonia herrerae]|uniref:Uncharacterized protein n=1 Tax=Escallonia herrerae TaxID=1293975 RepID=A0AA88WJB2_9ASTE|nr:hypothetical protein RJ639_040584 [Escallonia herrerae]
MAAPQNVELEAAKFLHKLIQESKDEPTKLATKLYVILQHMRSSGKESSMPYQVISRAMETVINQHGLDIEGLMSSRLPSASGTQGGDSASSQLAGSSQRVLVSKDSKESLAENELAASTRLPVGPSSAAHDIYQGSISHLNSRSFDHESPSSFDNKSANSQSQERRDSPSWENVNEKDTKKGSSKRKRADPLLPTEAHITNMAPLDARNRNPRADKMVNKVEPVRSSSVQGGESSHLNMVQSSSQMEHNPAMIGSMRSVLRAKQESQHHTDKSLDSTNITNLMPRHSKHPDEIEVSSAHTALGPQQGGSLYSTHDGFSSRGLWNQNRPGLPIEKSHFSRFPFHAGGGNLSAETLMQQSSVSSFGLGAAGKIQGVATRASGSFAPSEPAAPSPMQFSSTYGHHGKGTVGNALEHEGGISNSLAIGDKTVQEGIQNNVTEMPILRSAAPRDTGKSPLSPAPTPHGMPFKEQHLKQLRAQCLVFLAFRNNMMPKKLHLEIALGNFPNDDGPGRDVIDQKGNEQSVDDPSSTSEVATPFGKLENAMETERTPPGSLHTGTSAEVNMLTEAENNMTEGINFLPSGLSGHAEERKHLLAPRRKPEDEVQMKGAQPDAFSVRDLASTRQNANLESRHRQVGMTNQASSVMVASQQIKPEVIGWSGNGSRYEAPKVSLPTSAVPPEPVPAPERKDITPSQSQNGGDADDSEGNRHADCYLPGFSSRDHSRPLLGTVGGHELANPVKDADILAKSTSQVLETYQEEEDIGMSADMPPSPKYTTSEKWIMDHQKRKHLNEQKFVLKQQKTEQRITACSDKLKETVSSSENITAKTRSVIELRKLQLLDLQRRLRSDILYFFKPIATEMDILKSYKKHRIGRRSKQLERFEQKMKEERQRRTERLDDVFKMRKERWKGFSKYVREFHKRKERVHREKIDRIQREKINLLKVNDVEGYLRMVQDAKSDRVKQLLKETEKYLQKLSSKLQDAKSLARCFENDMDENRNAGVFEKNEFSIENEDETDQAKHYMEAMKNTISWLTGMKLLLSSSALRLASFGLCKFWSFSVIGLLFCINFSFGSGILFLIAIKFSCSIKENIADQPTSLVGGTLREYQMNGLRWLVSLYNNHLNGILADEMGLGKTVQVISLLCYLMETKNDRGPFLVVVPSSVLPGWVSEMNFWAPSINKIVYSGPPEERRKLFKETIVHQKFNVLLTTYEYLMNKHDRPKLSKLLWHYVIIDEGHRIKNASCKLNADLKHYRSSHRLLLTGTPLQNNLEELWALLNFLLPNIFNSSDDFSQWFNKPFEGSGDNSPDEALLSEEENLLIINRLHQVLRPFVLRRLKHKVENQLPEKIERLVRCEASAYQKLLMKRVEENLGAFGTSKARSVHNSVMELRNICNHPYLSQLHVEEVHDFLPKHYVPNIVRLCGKLEMLDRLLPKLKATDHRVLLFSTMTRLLDVMEDYLCWKQYRYLRLDGHTSGGDRGALIDQFNKSDSPFFIFLLSIRAGGVGVNLQAADTVIIFDTDWNPQVDLQAQARAHRIGQKREVLVLRLETVQTVEEQVRAAAEHKLGVANQSITAGFFDNNTSAADRREYLESLLRECKKEEAAPVLNDDALNDLIARSESEIDIFESVDQKRQEEEMAAWKKLVSANDTVGSDAVISLPARLLSNDDLKLFCEAMKVSELSCPVVVSSVGVKRKSEYLGALDTQQYGRGKRAREVRSYEEQWTEDEFEKLCQVDSPESPKLNEEVKQTIMLVVKSESVPVKGEAEAAALPPEQPPQPLVELPKQRSKDVTPSKRGRGRPKREKTEIIQPQIVLPTPPVAADNMSMGSQGASVSSFPAAPGPDSLPPTVRSITGTIQQFGPFLPVVPVLSASSGTTNGGSERGPISTSPVFPSSSILTSTNTAAQDLDIGVPPGFQPTPSLPPVALDSQSVTPIHSVLNPVRGRGRKVKSGGEVSRRRGKKLAAVTNVVPVGLQVQEPKSNENEGGNVDAKGQESRNGALHDDLSPRPKVDDNLSPKPKVDATLEEKVVSSESTNVLPVGLQVHEPKTNENEGGNVDAQKQESRDRVLYDNISPKAKVYDAVEEIVVSTESTNVLHVGLHVPEPKTNENEGVNVDAKGQESRDRALHDNLSPKSKIDETVEEKVVSTESVNVLPVGLHIQESKTNENEGGNVDAKGQESRDLALHDNLSPKPKVDETVEEQVEIQMPKDKKAGTMITFLQSQMLMKLWRN